jgi:hypothetical protein
MFSDGFTHGPGYESAIGYVEFNQVGTVNLLVFFLGCASDFYSRGLSIWRHGAKQQFSRVPGLRVTMDMALTSSFERVANYR